MYGCENSPTGPPVAPTPGGRVQSFSATTDDATKLRAYADRSRDPTRAPHGIYARGKGDSNPIERPRHASPRGVVRFRPPVAPTPGGRVPSVFTSDGVTKKIRRVPIAPATRHERRTGSTPEEKRFETHRMASPREPFHRRSFPPTRGARPTRDSPEFRQNLKQSEA